MIGYEKVKLKIIGVSPLLMHNGQLADPLNKWSKAIKEISGKRKKVDADLEEMARLEYFGGLYLKNGEPCIPGEVWEATLVSGAKKSKAGQQAKAAILVSEDVPVLYQGPRTPDALWADERFRLRAAAKVGPSRVMRTRPMFPEWSCDLEVHYLPDLLNGKDIVQFAQAAGVQVGICDWRPRFGRFMVN